MYFAQPALTPSPGTLATLLTNPQIQRATRAPDFLIESRALGALMLALAKAPGSMLEEISRCALQYCNAHSAGISLLEEQGKPASFQWRPLAAASFPVNKTLPGIQILTAIAADTLLAPFLLNGVPAGVLWVAAHDASHRFDAEDGRLLGRLAEFIAAGCGALISQDHLGSERAAHLERRHAVETALLTDRSKDRCISILAHELRGPIAPIRMAAHILRLKPPADADSARRVGELIDRQARDMLRLIDDLLDLSRLQFNEPVLRSESLMLSQLIERSVETTGPTISARSHELEVDLPEDDVLLHGDGMRICQALQNLIANAAKYTPDGGEIRVTACRERGEAVIRVADNGIGIQPERLGQIFNLYEQGAQAGTGSAAGGLGVGLYLARRLIEAHAGTIEARSDGEGRGSEFTLRIPCEFPVLSVGRYAVLAT